MEPLPRFAKQADADFVIGEVYRLGVIEERSQASHSHYFACLHDAWLNLPEELGRRFPTVEHLRKQALIRTGYHDERSIVCASEDEAQQVAAFVSPMDDYAFVTVFGNVVTVYTAKSQALRAMGKDVFQASKDAVLSYVADLIGVERGQLEQAHG